jgi:lipopolysaccharide export system permease protein
LFATPLGAGPILYDVLPTTGSRFRYDGLAGRFDSRGGGTVCSHLRDTVLGLVQTAAIEVSRTMIGFTLGRYLSSRFFRMIVAVFATMFSLVYVIDFVELLRRTGNIVGVSASTVAYLSFLRTPAVSEQVLPFCVLFGSMAVFLNLTRKLELLVARAAGVSVWQFLGPPVLIAVLIGIASITVLNPVSASMKQQADKMELAIFGGSGDAKGGIWVRQKSVDGESIMQAEKAKKNNNLLEGVTAYVYDRAGVFQQRVLASRATLTTGVWHLEDAQVSEPGGEPQKFGTYLLATNLLPGQVSESSMSAEAVPFWELSELRAQTEAAGLDGSTYRLQYQTLLARPLLLVAMTLIAAAFSLRFFRFGGIGKFVGGGVGAGFVLYVATKFVGDLGGSGLLSPSVAAWSPAIVASMLGALALLNQEDG